MRQFEKRFINCHKESHFPFLALDYQPELGTDRRIALNNSQGGLYSGFFTGDDKKLASEASNF